MSDRLCHRHQDTLIDVDALLSEKNWVGHSAEDLSRRLLAPTLRLMVRLLGLKVEGKRSAYACARAIAQHGANVQMGRV